MACYNNEGLESQNSLRPYSQILTFIHLKIFHVLDEPFEEKDQGCRSFYHHPSMLFSKVQYEEGEQLQRECLMHIREHRGAPFNVSFSFLFFNSK